MPDFGFLSPEAKKYKQETASLERQASELFEKGKYKEAVHKAAGIIYSAESYFDRGAIKRDQYTKDIARGKSALHKIIEGIGSQMAKIDFNGQSEERLSRIFDLQSCISGAYEPLWFHSRDVYDPKPTLSKIAQIFEEATNRALNSENRYITVYLIGNAITARRDMDDAKGYAGALELSAKAQKEEAEELGKLPDATLTSQQGFKKAQQSAEMAKLILKRGIIETKEESDERSYGKVITTLPIGLWLSAERIADFMDIDRSGPYDKRFTGLLSGFGATSTINFWVSSKDKPEDLKLKENEKHPIATVTAVRVKNTDDVEVRLRIQDNIRMEEVERQLQTQEMVRDGKFNYDKNLLKENKIDDAYKNNPEDRKWAMQKLDQLIVMGREAMLEGDVRLNIKCEIDKRKFDSVMKFESHLSDAHEIKVYGTIQKGGQLIFMTDHGPIEVMDTSSR